MSIHPSTLSTPLSQSPPPSPLALSTNYLLGDDSTHRADMSSLLSSQKTTVSKTNLVEEIELSCLIIGDGLDDVFPVQIEMDNTIGNLRVKIKDENKHLLQSNNAKSFVLWMVDIPLDDTDEQHLQRLQPHDGSYHFQQLRPWKRISTIWTSQPNHDRLHILVQIAKRDTVIKSMSKILQSESFRGSVFSFIPWIAALYFVVKSLQASAAQAYANLSQDHVPPFIVGYITNYSTEENLKAYGDMINFPSTYLMFLIAGVIIALNVLALFFFSCIDALSFTAILRRSSVVLSAIFERLVTLVTR